MQDKHPIAFFSKALSEQSLSRSTYEKEMMTLVLDTQNWRPYLVGRRFTAQTDEKSLRDLLQQPITTLTQQHWIAKLLGYDFEIYHKAGNTNRAADALSRCEEDMECQAITMPQWIDLHQIDQEVCEDLDLAEIITALERNELKNSQYNLV